MQQALHLFNEHCLFATLPHPAQVKLLPIMPVKIISYNLYLPEVVSARTVLAALRERSTVVLFDSVEITVKLGAGAEEVIAVEGSSR